MAIKNKKKGYAFSFFSLFLVIMIYFYAGIQFDKDTFSSQNNLQEYRIFSMNEEVTYFKETYLNDIFEVSSYIALDLLIKESNNMSVYNLYNKNYSALNDLLKEMLINGTLNGTMIPEMQNYTLTNLTNSYLQNNQRNYFLNTSFEVHDFLIYEEEPLSISLQALIEFNFISLDNVSSWNFNKTLLTKFQIYDIYDPGFYIIGNFGNKSAKINPVELYAANLNWNLDLFNETLQNQYTSIYYNPTFKYTIGNSFLKTLFNSTYGTYKNVFGFYSFDYDEENGSIYDTSRESKSSEFYGDSLILVNFQNHSALEDLTFYNHSITKSITLENRSNCIWDSCVIFDDSNNDFIEIENNFFLSNLSDFSLNIWFSPKNQTTSQTLISTGMNSSTIDGFEISLLPNFQGLNISFSCNNQDINYISNQNMEFGWNLLYLDLSVSNNISNIYFNGIKTDENLVNFLSCTSLNITQNIIIGANSNIVNNFYNSTIDEFSFYSKTLLEDQIGYLYNLNRVKKINYVDSLHGKGLHFDNDVLNISIDPTFEDFHTNDFSIGVWFYPENEKATLFSYETEFSVGYNQSGIFLSDNSPIPNIIFFENISIIPNRYNYLVFTQEGINTDIYLNNKISPSVIQIQGGPLVSQNNGGIFTFGSSLYPLNGVINQSFEGVIDEIIFYNKSLSRFEIEKQFYNFKAEVKGCCNYIISFNPHIYNHNSSTYLINTSYNSNLYFNELFRNQTNNITLYSVENITSQNTQSMYYNFLVDNCMLRAYNIYGYSGSSASFTTYREGDDGLLSCSWLIKNGYY